MKEETGEEKKLRAEALARLRHLQKREVELLKKLEEVRASAVGVVRRLLDSHKQQQDITK